MNLVCAWVSYEVIWFRMGRLLLHLLFNILISNTVMHIYMMAMHWFSLGNDGVLGLCCAHCLG